MLELTTKWMTNTLAKKSIQTNDFIMCNDGKQLFIVGYGIITNGGKNTYNYIIKDASTQIIVGEGENAYLDALTKIILGSNPKAKANKEESDKKNAKVSNNICEEYKRLEANLKKAIIAFNDFCVLYDIKNVEDAKKAQSEAQSAKRKAKQEARREETTLLKRISTLRKWAKETKRLELLQALNDKMLSI